MPPRQGTIDVSAKIIADISSGIYRTPANALKELISNAFDAGALKIIITTDYPDFNLFTITDDGKGMSVKEFQTIMGRIGGSDKRINEKSDEVITSYFGRPVIGKIGIGILAIAQICNKFTVISSTKGSGTKFKAIIDLNKFHDKEVYRYKLNDDKVNIGKYDIIDDLEEDIDKSYTRIILEDIDDGFKNRLKNIPEQSVYGYKLIKK